MLLMDAMTIDRLRWYNTLIIPCSKKPVENMDEHDVSAIDSNWRHVWSSPRTARIPPVMDMTVNTLATTNRISDTFFGFTRLLTNMYAVPTQSRKETTAEPEFSAIRL